MTDEQLDQAIGRFPVSDTSIRASRRPRREVTDAQQSVRRVVSDATIISAKYNEVSRRARRDAREVVDQAELTTDRQFLDELIADEYRLTNPFGKIEGKQETINKILSGTIRPENFGTGGFETVEEELQAHGAEGIDTAVLTSTFTMRGSGLARFTRSGAVRWRDLSGTYRTTHTYVFRDGRWQLAATQMTAVPPRTDFVFVGEEDS